MGKGEYAAAFANMRALTVTIGPLLFGNIYAYSKANGYGGGTPWLVAMVLGSVIPLVLHETVSDEDIKRGLEKPLEKAKEEGEEEGTK
jgi:hypothetical protein